jgi:hypothetical protein
MNQQMLDRAGCADSILTVVYFDVRNGCVFEFNTPQRRWNGTYRLENDHLEINWRSPTEKPVFRGIMAPAGDSGRLTLTGVLGKDSVDMVMQKLTN